ncbi:NifB/NifX family molybdenum-iron cluster-binding protein [Marinifilum sp. D737]|uniref:NifB/NifX family molybdenum-iron cluster-binding protein n=1 Tax=Marinifilum sp. D737 TaxID=2969628 RepID=UPI0022738C6C|nr:NifB/NifX family molybdenum-iron cluster-binding protein [Marinifilum sp. D737]MCY1635156.1 NifB/NifX family molybdenum-iron cluster-binding protein [Marinifilum sp. D737]
MKIAVPVTSSKQVDGHFGHCEFYNIYTVSEQNEIVGSEIMDSPQACGCKSNIAPLLAEAGVKVMLAGGIGQGAINVLYNNGIEVVRGCSGSADELVQQFISGMVEDSGETCNHHHGADGHSCNH